jgi:hypothetical protein
MRRFLLPVVALVVVNAGCAGLWKQPGEPNWR